MLETNSFEIKRITPARKDAIQDKLLENIAEDVMTFIGTTGLPDIEEFAFSNFNVAAYNEESDIAGYIECGAYLTTATATIHTVYVFPDNRRRGCAAELIKQAERYYRKLSVVLMQVSVFEQTKPMQELLNKLGYSKAGYKNRERKCNGEWWNMLYFAKFL